MRVFRGLKESVGLCAALAWGGLGCGTVPGGDGPDTGLNCPDLSVATTFSDKEATGADHRIDCLAVVSGALTIEPGVEIAFGPGAGLSVLGGSLKAKGTAEKPIVLRGASAERGFWEGVTLNSSSPANTLEHVTVRHAGRTQAALTVGPGARLTLARSALEESKGLGLVVQEAAEVAFEKNTITKNTKEPVSLAPGQIRILDGDSEFSGNGSDRVLVAGGSVSAGDHAWAEIDVPFFVTGDLFIDGSARVTIGGGTTFRFDTDKGLRVGGSASLAAAGTEEKRVRFLAADDVSGVWAGLRIDSPSPQNALRFVELAQGGSAAWDSNDDRAGVILGYEGRLTLEDSIVRDSERFGLHVLGSDATLSFARNTLRGNALEPVVLPASLAKVIDGASVLGENDRAFVRLAQGEVDGGTASWEKLSVPYLVTESVRLTDDAALTVEAGAELRFVDDRGLLVLGTASLTITGTQTQPVLFRGESAAPAAWQGVFVESLNTSNVFEYLIVEHAGSSAFNSNGDVGSIIVYGGKLLLKNSTIKGSGECGVNLANTAAAFTGENNTITGVTNSVCGQG